MNTEYRTYKFSDAVDTEDLDGNHVDGDNATLVETPESRQRRGKTPEAPSRVQQRVFYKQGLEGWGSQGLQPTKEEREEAELHEVNGSRI